MTSTKIELSHNRIRRLADLSDLAEILFPSNRNQQHAFLVVWLALKWADQRMVPNLMDTARKRGVSRRTVERVRAKMRRFGLIDHVSRFNAGHGYREGWVLSSRFERGLRLLAEKVAGLRDTQIGSKEKELMLLSLADARREVPAADRVAANHNDSIHGGDEI